MKIVYCINSISYIGGTESVTVTKANVLAEIKGNQVYIVVTDLPDAPVFEVSPKVKIIDLDVNHFTWDPCNPVTQFFRNRKKLKLQKRRLEKLLNEIIPEVVISTGWSEKNLLPKIKYQKKPLLIRELHFATHYRLFLAKTKLSKLINKVVEWKDYIYNIRGYDRLVLLTEEDRLAHWKDNPKVVTIPNPVKPNHGECSSCEAKCVISVGRLSRQKNYSSLIRAWSIVNKCYPDWTLKIYGEGEELHLLAHVIEQLQLTDSVLLMGPTTEVFEVMSNSSFFVLTSVFEGFGLVLVEAMSVGLPIVSYDCPCGPKDIIEDGENGFLVPQGDEENLAEKIIWLIEHPDQRKIIGQKALQMSENYKVEVIANRWMSLFEELIQKHR